MKATCLVLTLACTLLGCGDSKPTPAAGEKSGEATSATSHDSKAGAPAASNRSRSNVLAAGGETGAPRYIYLGSERRESTPLPAGKEFRVTASPLANGRLEVAVGLPVKSSKAEKKLEHGVFIVERIVKRADGEARSVLAKQRILARRNRLKSHWTEVQVDLSPYAGQDLELAFRFNSSLDVAAAEVTVPWISYPRRVGERNVILVSLDTLRADRLNSYGYDVYVTSPNLDALAAEGARFASAFSNSPWTTPSHMSLFTSLYPSAHGLDAPIRKLLKTLRPALDSRVPTLPEFLRAEGFSTAAITGGATITGRYGFDRGFASYDELVIQNGIHLEEELKAADSWLTRHEDRRFFFFLHTFEIHKPYMNRRYEEQVQRNEGSERELMNARYAGDLYYTDELMGSFFAMLKERGLFDNSIIIIFSDHGENLHDRFVQSDRPYGRGHGYQMHEEMLHVPLIFVAPGLIEPRQVIDAQIETIDILPTLLGLLEIDPKGATFQGRDLSPALLGKSKLADAPSFASSTIYGPERKSIRSGGMKYVWIADTSPDPDRQIPFKGHVWDWSGLPEHELFDLERDPLEQENIAATQPETVARLHEMVSDQESRNQEIRVRPDSSGQFGADVDDLDALRALGYIE